MQTLASLAVSPATPAIAASAPPLYALVAAVHSVMPFLARVLVGIPWTATITAAIAGMLVWPFSAIGPLIIVPLVASAATFDLGLLGSRSPSRRRLVLAAASAGVVLFLVSLPVFSPDHLTPLILGATLLGRTAGELLALAAATALAAALSRAGVGARRD